MNEDPDVKLLEQNALYDKLIHQKALLERKLREIDQSQSKEDIKKIHDDLQEKLKKNQENLTMNKDWIKYYTSIKIIRLLKSFPH